MTYVAEIKIRFGHEDHARIVYYPRFFDYFHQAFEDFFASEGRDYRTVLTEDKLGWPAVHAEADFIAPLRFGDVLNLALSVVRIGDKSVTFRYEGTRAADAAPIVKGQTTVVCIDMETFEGRAIPPSYRSMFERHMLDGVS